MKSSNPTKILKRIVGGFNGTSMAWSFACNEGAMVQALATRSSSLGRTGFIKEAK